MVKLAKKSGRTQELLVQKIYRHRVRCLDLTARYNTHEDMHTEIPNSELVFFEESGHFPFITEAEKYKSVVQDWVARL